jgi:hypothetical protein
MKRSKYILPVVLLALLLWGCGHATQDDRLPADIVNNPVSASDEASERMPKIEFAHKEHDFGKLIQGEKVTYAFKFKNTGNTDLIISDVSSSCGCTVPSYTDKPVKPGETGVLQVTFDSDGRKGFQHKTVTVVTNTIPNTTLLKIKAMVIIPGSSH